MTTRQPFFRMCGKIECAVELVALYADKRQQGLSARFAAKQSQVLQISMHVLVDRMHFDRRAADKLRSHARTVRHGAIGHKALVKTLDETLGRVLAGFENNHS